MEQESPKSADAAKYASLAGVPEQASRDDRFEPVEIRGVLNRDRFLDELNRDRDYPGSTFKLTPGRPLLDSVRLPKAVVSPSAQLRLYVDEWLDTGLDTQGVEDPNARDLTEAPNACAAVYRFNGKHPAQVEPARDGLRLKFPSELSVSGIGSLADTAIDVADRRFALFLLCDWRARLAKCRHVGCGRYFELKHWNQIRKRGAFCPNCQRKRSVESAARSASEARAAARTGMYRLTARRFKRRLLKGWDRDRQLKTTIVAFLNDQIEETGSLKSVYPRGITEKWLSSKNRNGIKQAARGEVHAKG